MLWTLNGLELDKVVAFYFKASSNKVEYKALIIGMQLDKVYGAAVLNVYCDLQLVVNQVQGEFKEKKASMNSYRTIV